MRDALGAVVRVSPLDRLVWAGLLCGCLFVLGAARWLTPSADGVGTHTQLGLPPCGFLVLLGAPCPACGLTTSFAHLAEFELAHSLEAHPVGLPLFLLTALCAIAAARGVVRGDSVMGFLDRIHAERVALALAGALLSTWFVRLVL